MPIRTGVYRTATLYAGIYYGVYDTPQLDVDGRQYILGNRPVFNSLGALGARVDFQVPLSETLDGIVGVRYWAPIGRDALPETWSVFIGVSIPIGRILKATLGEAN